MNACKTCGRPWQQSGPLRPPKRVRWFIREAMIGWHQGGKERHRAAAARHAVAERRWRSKNAARPSPLRTQRRGY